MTATKIDFYQHVYNNPNSNFILKLQLSSWFPTRNAHCHVSHLNYFYRPILLYLFHGESIVVGGHLSVLEAARLVTDHVLIVKLVVLIEVLLKRLLI